MFNLEGLLWQIVQEQEGPELGVLPVEGGGQPAPHQI